MPGTYDLQGKFIADTYTHLMQKPDINKEEYYNGNGDPIIVINRDAIGTIKMFYPANGVLANYFDTSTGLPQNSTTYPDAAVWQGWALCDGQGGRPDLRGRFIVGHTYNIPGDTSTNSQKNVTAFQQVGTAGAGNYPADDTAEPIIDIWNLPPHRHKYTFLYPELGNNQNGWATIHQRETGGAVDMTHTDGNQSTGNPDIDKSNGGDVGTYVNYANTSTGTDNLNGQDALLTLPNPFYPAYVALVYVMRVS